MQNKFPIKNKTETIRLFQGSIKFGTNIDKVINTNCTLTYDSYSNNSIKVGF